MDKNYVSNYKIGNLSHESKTCITLKKRQTWAKYAFALGVLVFFAASAFSQTFVSQTRGSDANTGASWTTAYKSITKAVAGGASTIYIDEGTYSLSTTAESYPIAVPGRNLNIQGGFPTTNTGTSTSNYDASANNTILEGAGTKQLLTAGGTASGYTLLVKGLILQHGQSTAGAAVYATSMFSAATNWTFEDVNVINNIPTDGAINFTSFQNGKATFNHCYFTNNIATGNGGGISFNSILGATISFNNCAFKSNNSSIGGAAFIQSAYNSTSATLFSFNNSSFCSNSATNGGGGAINAQSSGVSVDGCYFSQNQASSDGGAINCPASYLLCTNSQFWNNSSPSGMGGAISRVAGGNSAHGTNTTPITYTGCTFVSNSAGGASGGGAIYDQNASNHFGVQFDRSTFITNSSSSAKGGTIALFNSFGPTINMSDASFYNNSYGGSPTAVGCDLYFSYAAGSTLWTISNTSLQIAQSNYTPGYSFSSGNTFVNTVVASPPQPSCETTIILPVSGLALTTTLVNGIPKLTWTTLFEQNTSYFAIQRSTDGVIFSTIGKTPAAGNSNAALTYKYADNTATGTVYYRIATIDKDAAVTYSNIVVVNSSGTTQLSYKLSPNPTSNLVNIQGLAIGSHIALLDMNGKKMAEAIASGANQSISLGSYAKGVYILSIQAAGGSTTNLKVVKQ